MADSPIPDDRGAAPPPEPVWPSWQPYPPASRAEDRRLVQGEGRYTANIDPTSTGLPEKPAVLHAG
ncbi:MAG: hypothetical protein OEZ14_13220, partial [Acidimicrobiia bacterium]|nr:hypothetical protein [Acidimicrobiia bacterium]